jgi:hypothetical protein
MSNYHSIIHNYGQPQSTFDANLAVQALSYKQGKYDANAAKIQEALNTYGNIELAREEDREYLYQRLNSLVNNIKGLKGADLASSNVTSQITGHISKALDERVIKQYGNTQKIKNFQAQMQEKQSKKPETFDEKNYAFALEQAGYQNYMSGEVDDLGQLTYRDFVDLGKERKEIALNLNKFTDLIKRTTPEGIYYVTKEGKRLDKEQARRIIETQLSDKGRGQMEINAWATYEKGMPEEQLNQRFGALAQATLGRIDTRIADFDLQIKNANTEDKREQLTLQKEEWVNYRDLKATSFESASNRAKALALEEEDFFGGFANTYFKDPNDLLTVEYKTNSAELQRQRELSRAAKERATGLTEDGQNLVDIVNQPYTPEERRNLYNKTLQDAEKNDEIYKQGVKSLFNTVDADTRKTLEKKFEQVKDKYDSFEDFLFDEFDSLATVNSNIIKISDLENIRQAKTLAEYNYKKFNTARTMAFEELEATGIRQIFDVVNKNKNIPIVDERGQRVSARDWLQQKGINSIEDLENNPEVREALLKQYYADMALSEQKAGREFREGIGSAIKAIGRGLIGDAPGFARNYAIGDAKIQSVRESSIYRDRLIELVGEEEATRYLGVVQAVGAYDDNKGWDDYSNLMTVPTLGLINLLNPDNSFEDDSRTRNLITQDNIQTTATRLMNERGEVFGRPVATIINPNSTVWQAMANYIASDATSELGDMGYLVNEKSPITLRVVDADTVELSSVTMNTQSGERVSQPQGKRILKANLPPIVQEHINTTTTQSVLNNNNFPEFESRVEYGTSSNMKRINDLSNAVFGGQKDLAFTTTKEETLGRMYNGFSKVMGTPDAPTEVGQLMNQIVNSNDFLVRTANIDGEIYKEIWFNDGRRERKLFTEPTPIGESALDSQYRMVKYAPQFILNYFLTSVLTEVSQNRHSNYYQELRNLYAARN